MAGNYDPVVVVYTGTPSSLTTIYTTANANAPAYFLVTPNTRLYFKVSQSHSGVTPDQNLTFTITRAPTNSVPAGSIVVPDVSPGFPGAIISPTTGAILRYVVMPGGESGTINADGIWSVEDSANNQVRFYDSSLSEMGSIAIDMNGNGQIVYDSGGNFWIGYPTGSNAFLKRTTNTGALLHTYTLGTGVGTIRAGTPNQAGTIYYWAVGSAVNGPVKRYDLVNEIALSDLVAGISDAAIGRDIVVLSDDTILVHYRPTTGVNYVKRYNSSGATLNTYNFSVPATNNIERISINPNDSSVFFVWEQTTSPLSLHTFSKIRVSDGAVLSSVTAPRFVDGMSQDTPSDDMSQFGASFSCPMIVTSKPVTSSIGSTATGSQSGGGGDNTTPCECCCPTGETNPPPGNPGDVIPPELPHDWVSMCGFGGLAPDGNEPTNSEDYYVA